MFSLSVPTKTYAKSFYIKENVKKVWFSHARRNFSFFMYIKRTKQTEQGEHICKISKKIINPGRVGVPRRFQFFGQKIWFLVNYESLSKTVHSTFHC